MFVRANRFVRVFVSCFMLLLAQIVFIQTGLAQVPFGSVRSNFQRPYNVDEPDPPDPRNRVRHAGLPLELAVNPLPLENSDHELKFNVSWLPPKGRGASDYSLEVRSVTGTADCRTPMCYEYNIPGDATWWCVPSVWNPVADTCAVRPGCAYTVKLIAHPWDGRTSANLLVELDECVSGICSCAYSPRLPPPDVKARTVSIHGEIFANVSWTLPSPKYPQRLPPGLRKHSYIVSIGKQMVSDAHPSPWFANTITRRVDAGGLVSEGDRLRWLLLPINERRHEESAGRKHLRPLNVVLDVKLLARVNLVDDRMCVGPAGNATAYDPADTTKVSVTTYTLWAAFGGACVLAMVVILAVGARVIKRVLNAFRPPPVSASFDPSRRPLQLRA